MADEVIVFAGGGGKTTSIYTYAKKTGGRREKSPDPDNDPYGSAKGPQYFFRVQRPQKDERDTGQIRILRMRENLKRTGKKITAWTDGQMKVLEGLADTVLIEGDGAKRMPLKVPACYEPVIPDWSSRLVIVLGLSGLGMPCARAVHRWQLLFPKRMRS